jgi:hypothetical protein
MKNSTPPLHPLWPGLQYSSVNRLLLLQSINEPVNWLFMQSINEPTSETMNEAINHTLMNQLMNH